MLVGNKCIHCVSGIEDNVNICFQVCWRPRSMAWIIRSLHQWTWVSILLFLMEVWFQYVLKKILWLSKNVNTSGMRTVQSCQFKSTDYIFHIVMLELQQWGPVLTPCRFWVNPNDICCTSQESTPSLSIQDLGLEYNKFKTIVHLYISIWQPLVTNFLKKLFTCKGPEVDVPLLCLIFAPRMLHS